MAVAGAPRGKSQEVPGGGQLSRRTRLASAPRAACCPAHGRGPKGGHPPRRTRRASAPRAACSRPPAPTPGWPEGRGAPATGSLALRGAAGRARNSSGHAGGRMQRGAAGQQQRNLGRRGAAAPAPVAPAQGTCRSTRATDRSRASSSCAMHRPIMPASKSQRQTPIMIDRPLCTCPGE